MAEDWSISDGGSLLKWSNYHGCRHKGNQKIKKPLHKSSSDEELDFQSKEETSSEEEKGGKLVPSMGSVSFKKAGKSRGISASSSSSSSSSDQKKSQSTKRKQREIITETGKSSAKEKDSKKQKASSLVKDSDLTIKDKPSKAGSSRVKVKAIPNDEQTKSTENSEKRENSSPMTSRDKKGGRKKNR